MADPAADGLIYVADYRWVTHDTATPSASVEQALDDAIEIVQDSLHRALAYASYTETLRVYRDGKVYPTNTPLAAVTAPAVAASAVQGAGVYLGTFTPVPPLVNTGDWNTPVPPQTTVTYTGGYQPYGGTGGATAQLPLKVMRAVCRVAWLILHPVSLPGVPVGAKSASVGDVSISGNDLSSFAAVDPSIERDLRGYRKRKALGWQRSGNGTAAGGGSSSDIDGGTPTTTFTSAVDGGTL